MVFTTSGFPGCHSCCCTSHLRHPIHTSVTYCVAEIESDEFLLLVLLLLLMLVLLVVMLLLMMLLMVLMVMLLVMLGLASHFLLWDES